ncbi:NACHT domain-containing protein [Streptomyces sp. NPDC089173]|uniref:NACHT domain-containing protein n=1 Tax=Streptomyces sp. NPDC089173 TaxID=3154965 RepID=UPI0034506768
MSYVRLTQPADRTVAVFGARQGSGVLLTERLVLTCAHVVGTGTAQVAHPANRDRTRATVAWHDPGLDAALLLADEPVRPVAPARLGVVSTHQAIPGCEITGFPSVQRYGPDRRLEADQYTATVLPLAGRLRDLLVCELDAPPAARPDDEAPALSGLSGGPVFAGDVLLGIARQIPLQRDGRRVECVALGPIVDAESFAQTYRRTGELFREERVYGNFPADLRYEAEYAQALGVAYRRTKVFGLDELRRHDSEWDLDTAYLSLEALAENRDAQSPPLPQRIDTLLTDRPRVLLRGEAGVGKTTLLSWLAAHASARTLDAGLAPLNGLVPFVVPLRTLRNRGGTFPGPAELSGSAGLVIDTASEGWAGRVLVSGRALLLVDGLDEVLPEEREQAYTWLSQLLARYPETRCVVTVRPLAVETDWLRSEGFADMQLLKMRNADIQAFLTLWHRAARLSEPDDAEALDELERDLSRQFEQNPALRDLARTPLLCAVICALHRHREGFLPETRWQLYRSALEMLLGNRDRLRRVGEPEGIGLAVEEHTQLLQRIAVRLVREGQLEFTRAQGLRQICRALAGMERVAEQGPPEKILTHLLNRSGLLQESRDGTYQFIHRTFQDYLAAKEFVEDDYIKELVLNSGHERWQDVILLAAGHCDRRQLAVLVLGLLDAGLAHREGTRQRSFLHVLAALCAQHAAWLDGSVRERVRASVAALFPPAGDEQRKTLARLGQEALAVLPQPDSVPVDGTIAEEAVRLLCLIGGEATIPAAKAWARAHPGLGGTMADGWNAFPPEAFAREVLSHYRLAGTTVTVTDPREAKALRQLPSADALAVGGVFSESELSEAFHDRAVTFLVIAENPSIRDLSALRSCAESLSHLFLRACPRIDDLGPLRELRALLSLKLDLPHLPTALLAPLTDLPCLASLGLTSADVGRLSELPAFVQVRRLALETGQPVTLDALDAWPALTALELVTADASFDTLAVLRDHPRITRLELTGFPRHSPGPTTVDLASITDLTVPPPPASENLKSVLRAFPALTRLSLRVPGAAEEVDLTALRDRPGVHVTVDGPVGLPLVGAEELGDRLKVTAS